MTNQKLFAKIETPEQADMARVLTNRKDVTDFSHPYLEQEGIDPSACLACEGGKFSLVCYGIESAPQGKYSTRSESKEAPFDTVVATGLKGQEEAVRGIAEIIDIYNEPIDYGLPGPQIPGAGLG